MGQKEPDITLLLEMASMLPCDPRHKSTLVEAKETIISLRAELTEEKDISRQLRDALALERKRRENSDKALELACDNMISWKFEVPDDNKEKADYFRKKAEEKG